MELPSPESPSNESRRFTAALIAAIVFHALFFAAWSALPFARAEPMTATVDAEAPAMEVQFIAPPPEPVTPPPPEPAPEPAPEPPAPEPPPAVEQVITALEETEPKPEPVIEEPPAPLPPVAETPPPPPPPPVPAPKPKPKATPKPVPAPRKPTAIVARQPAPAAAAAAPAPTAPSYRSNPKPAYPAEAKRLRIEGTTYLKVEVLASGKVGTVAVVKSSGSRLLDQSAATTVQTRWRFRPATRAGRAVNTFVTVPVRFTLR